MACVCRLSMVVVVVTDVACLAEAVKYELGDVGDKDMPMPLPMELVGEGATNPGPPILEYDLCLTRRILLRSAGTWLLEGCGPISVMMYWRRSLVHWKGFRIGDSPLPGDDTADEQVEYVAEGGEDEFAEEREAGDEGDRSERLMESRCDRALLVSVGAGQSCSMFVVMKTSSEAMARGKLTGSRSSSFSYSSPGNSRIVQRGIPDAEWSAESSRSISALVVISRRAIVGVIYKCKCRLKRGIQN